MTINNNIELMSILRCSVGGPTNLQPFDHFRNRHIDWFELNPNQLIQPKHQL